jgi:hypothetical protein
MIVIEQQNDLTVAKNCIVYKLNDSTGAKTVVLIKPIMYKLSKTRFLNICLTAWKKDDKNN